ncbi:MAG: MiaB/RimO family radical SAM methylthiotransferase [Thermoleophilia bacterium]
MTRVYAAFVGCKVSQADSEAALAALVAAGHTPVTSRDEADLCLLLSCCVTAEAERKSRQAARRLAGEGRRVIVAGCAAALRPGQFAGERIEVLGDRPWTALATGTHGSAVRGGGNSGVVEAPSSPMSDRRRTRTRLTLKVQDGCEQRCTYCTVCLARGPLWSRPLVEVLAAARAGLAGGCGEVVLSGINLGMYRDPQSGAGLPELIECLTALDELVRLRLSSLEPVHLQPDLFAALAHAKVARHLHVPLQSADDSVLAGMGRPYTFAEYSAAIAALRRRLPGLLLSTDVIIGFPTEDEAAFERTLAVISAVAPAPLAGPGGRLFGRVHLFTYSSRPGTAAAALTPLPADVVKGRMQAALAVARSAAHAASLAAVGQPAEVLVEERRDGFWRGYSSTYLRYYLQGEAHGGQLVSAVATGEYNDGLKGFLV